RVLGHVERVLVPHVDDARADLDPAGPRADGGQQRERAGELPGEVVHAEVGAVGPELLRGHGQLDRLQQGVGRAAHLRVRRRRPVTETQETDFLHTRFNIPHVKDIPGAGPLQHSSRHGHSGGRSMEAGPGLRARGWHTHLTSRSTFMPAVVIVVVAVLFLGIGLYGPVAPAALVRPFGVAADTAEARTEIRAVYGGFGVAVAGLLIAAAADAGGIRTGVAVTVAAALLGMASGRLVARMV